MELDPAVTVAPLLGGYVVQVEEYDPEADEWISAKHVALSIEEVCAHVRRALESHDRQPAKDYERIEKARPRPQ